MYDIDKDMALLQTSLIGDIKTIKKEKLHNTLYVGALVIGLGFAILFSRG
jgi:hypothetical protein